MFRHIVLFRWTPDTTAEHISAIAEGLATLPGAIEEIQAYRFGADLGLTDGNFEFAIVADFASEADWRTYRDHPVHQQVIADRIKVHIAERAAVQQQFDD